MQPGPPGPNDDLVFSLAQGVGDVLASPYRRESGSQLAPPGPNSRTKRRAPAATPQSALNRRWRILKLVLSEGRPKSSEQTLEEGATGTIVYAHNARGLCISRKETRLAGQDPNILLRSWGSDPRSATVPLLREAAT